MSDLYDDVQNMHSSDSVSKEFEKAKNLTYKYLARREHSEKEVRNYLAGKGFTFLTIDAVIQRMVELDYLNDRRFAQVWVKNRAEEGRKGPEFLKKELLEKGISADLIEDIILDNYDDSQEYAAALQAVRKKVKSYQKDLEDAQKRYTIKGRLWRFLLQRGFKGHIIEKVVNQVLEEEN